MPSLAKPRPSARAAGRLARFLEGLRKRPPSPPIDVEAEWPPADGSVVLVAYTGFLFDRQRPKRPAKHRLESEAWGGGDIQPKALLRLLVKARGPKSKSARSGPPIYVRIHDSAWSIALDTGKTVWDRNRPDRVAPSRRPVRRAKGAPLRDASRAVELRRGQKIEAARWIVQAKLGLPPAKLSKLLLTAGIRVMLEDDGETIRTVTYVKPYRRKVCGVWLGASASEVEQILGAPVEEFEVGSGARAWTYDHDGHLGIAFDKKDRVAAITR